MVFISIVFIPIFGLTIFHIILVARGRTTNEQVTGKFQGSINPFSRGLFFNCLYTLCGPRYPGYALLGLNGASLPFAHMSISFLKHLQRSSNCRSKGSFRRHRARDRSQGLHGQYSHGRAKDVRSKG